MTKTITIKKNAPKILENARWERFANLLAQGRKQVPAYKEAGFSPNNRSAKKLAANPAIKGRVLQLQEIAVASTTLSIERVLNELEKIGFSNMLDYIKIDEEGQPQLDFTTLERDKAAAIGEITTDVITSPRDGSVTKRTKFKLLDKKGALVDLGRYLGMFIDRKQVQVGGIMFHVTPDDLAL